jgi:hypothetical protein
MQIPWSEVGASETIDNRLVVTVFTYGVYVIPLETLIPKESATELQAAIREHSGAEHPDESDA